MEIPSEIITEILTRLPVKPLSRFKCVSKSWNSLISSPSFITHHLNSNPNCNIIVTSHECDQSPKSLFSALVHNDLNSHKSNNASLYFSQLDHPFKINLAPLNGDVYVIDSCNGILLISDSGTSTMFLYNPANNTYRLLPPVRIRLMESFGFVYDSYADEYKVIRVFQNSGVNLEIYVYSMRENVWKYIEDDSPLVKKYFLNVEYPVVVNGVLVFKAGTIDFKVMFMCFDVRTEAFSTVDYCKLESYDFSNKVSTRVKELHGRFCLLVNYQRPGEDLYSRLLLYADVWEMRGAGKEASWVKLFRVQNSELVGKFKRCSCIALVAYSKDKSKLLIEVDNTWFGLYDLVTKRVKKVNTHGLWKNYYSAFTIMTYVESLVSVSNNEHLTLEGVQA